MFLKSIIQRLNCNLPTLVRVIFYKRPFKIVIGPTYRRLTKKELHELHGILL